VSKLGLGASLASLVALAASFPAWQAAAYQAASTPEGALDGAALFAAKGCAGCHTGPDTAAGFGAFPALTGAASWAGERRPPSSAAAYLAESIREPSAFRSPALGSAGPDAAMPALGLTGAEIDALVAYLLQG
jgi:mono/diheme cytochrome c family protein